MTNSGQQNIKLIKQLTMMKLLRILERNELLIEARNSVSSCRSQDESNEGRHKEKSHAKSTKAPDDHDSAAGVVHHGNS